MKICVLPGDGIGVEIMAEAVRVLKSLDLQVEIEEALLGGCAVDATGNPYPDATQKLAQASDAVLLGAVGGPKWDALPREQRPERGLLGPGEFMAACGLELLDGILPLVPGALHDRKRFLIGEELVGLALLGDDFVSHHGGERTEGAEADFVLSAQRVRDAGLYGLV